MADARFSTFVCTGQRLNSREDKSVAYLHTALIPPRKDSISPCRTPSWSPHPSFLLFFEISTLLRVTNSDLSRGEVILTFGGNTSTPWPAGTNAPRTITFRPCEVAKCCCGNQFAALYPAFHQHVLTGLLLSFCLLHFSLQRSDKAVLRCTWC